MSISSDQIRALSDRVRRLVYERNEARQVARAILTMAQGVVGSQLVSDHVLTVHPWLVVGSEEPVSP